ncbi:MAG: TVP38/TMEM64 family protein [Jaaginema sp. PMC 1079.18]|nr:TVP38/TMEM64 family protein [Jaaginema sp. PMC 1080.18]MEC4850516.1 TVP38/TMEM64 family protein [Jaaginema sp. PMC 1079.18]MEC4864773.1 TVP38/TMEM64 family protein [Jaaginema sp. PMC 1078.18]
MSQKILKFIAIFVVVAGAIITAKMLGLFGQINALLESALNWIEGLGAWGAIAFIAIYILASVLLISGAVLTLGAGFIFGVVKGSILVSVASTLAATVSFLIGRYIARGWVSQQIAKQPRFKAIDNAVAQEGWKIVGLTRLSPVFPFVFLNYAFGVTQVSLRDYVLASWIGMMPGTVAYVYLGFLPRVAATGGGNIVRLVLNIVGVVATIAVTWYVTKIAKKALDRQIEAKDSDSSLVAEDDITPVRPES